MKIKNVKFAVFCWGMSCGVCLVAIHQDILGKEEYLRQVGERWISSCYTLPVEIIVVAFCIFMTIYVKEK